MFWRNPSAAFFNFLLPLLLLVLFGATAFASDDERARVLIPGIAGMGVMATTFTRAGLQPHLPARARASSSAIRGTPMPTGAYLAGIVGSRGHQRASCRWRSWSRSASCLRRGLAAGPAAARWLFIVARRHLLRLARRGVLARDPELGGRARVLERGVPAGDLHLRRLLLGRRPAATPEGEWRRRCRSST